MKPTFSGAPCAIAGVGNRNPDAAVVTAAAPNMKPRRLGIEDDEFDRDIALLLCEFWIGSRGQKQSERSLPDVTRERFFPTLTVRTGRTEKQDRLCLFLYLLGIRLPPDAAISNSVSILIGAQPERDQSMLKHQEEMLATTAGMSRRTPTCRRAA